MDNLYSEIISRNNLLKSAKQVKSKSCTAVGIDNIPCKMADVYLQEYIEELIMSLSQDKYIPKAIKRIGIEKPNGGIRYIGVPTIMDKIIQLSIVNILTPIYEDLFNPFSYGFRSNRNIHQAINKAKTYLDDGYTFMVQIDIQNFFDSINHDKMMSELYKTIKDKQVLKLIRLYLQSDIIYGHKIIKSKKGLVQGGNLSPLLANVYLTPLDNELSRRGIRFIRYADDLTLFCDSKQSAIAIKDNISRFIENKLMLKINQSKTVVIIPTECNLLGFQFSLKEGTHISCIPNSSVKRLTLKIKGKINNAKNYEETKQAINDELTGWYAHYKHADRFIFKKMIKTLDRMILEMLYKKFGSNQNIKDFKEQLWNDNRSLFMIKNMQIK